MKKERVVSILSKFFGAFLVLLLVCSVRAAEASAVLTASDPFAPIAAQLLTDQDEAITKRYNDAYGSVYDDAGFRDTVHQALVARTASVSLTRYQFTFYFTDKMEDTDPEKSLLEAHNQGISDGFRDVLGEIANDPQLFYVLPEFHSDMTSHDGKIFTYTELKFSYDEAMLRQLDAFNARVDEALALVDGVSDPVMQLLILHDHLVRTIQYDWDTLAKVPERGPNIGNAFGAFMEGNAVCEGYAKAYKLLLDRLSIESDYAYFPGHIWNIVKLNGKWYHIDVTWDDPGPNIPGAVLYSHFLLPETEMAASHGQPSELPAGISCTDRTYMTDDWIFRQFRPQLHFRPDGIYVLALNGSGRDAGLTHWDGLRGPARPIASSLGGSSAMAPGSLILDNQLYYFTYRYETATLCRFNLRTGVRTELASFPFHRVPSVLPDSIADSDFLGLEYDSDTNQLLCWSSSRPDAPLHVYQLPQKSTGLDTVTRQGNSLSVSLFCAVKDADAAQAWVGFYDRGRLVEAQSGTTLAEGKGSAAFTCDQVWDSACVTILGDHSKPLCTEVRVTPN